MKFIHNLRKKPDSYKRSFAFFVSGGVTAIVFGVWIISRLISPNASTDQADNLAEDSSSKSFSPFSVITNQFGSIFSEFKQEVAGVGFSNEGTSSVNTTESTTETTRVDSAAEASTSVDATQQDSQIDNEMRGDSSATPTQ